MRALRYFGDEKVRMIDIPEPQITRPDDVKIRVAYCGICGSDLHFKRAEFDFMMDKENGFPLGHEATGTVVELGPAATAKGLKIGDRVTYYFNEHCGSCYYCRNGQEQFCSNKTSNMSAMADYIVVREQAVYKLADTCSMQRGALVEPISVSLHGIDLCKIKAGMSVAISGGGAMGLILTQLAHRSGATNLTVIEPIASKRELAMKMGADHVIDPVTQDRKEEALKITNGIGFDVVIEASGSVRACDGIETLVAKGGTLEFFAALYRPDYNYQLNLFGAFWSEMSVVGGVMQSPYMFPRSVALVESLNLDPMLPTSCIYEAENFEAAFADQLKGVTVKSLLRFDPNF